MARPRRTKGQRERDLILVSELYLRGETQDAMAIAVSKAGGYDPPLHRSQIGYDVKILHKRWLKEQLFNLDEAKARELARIDKLEREAWAAWERSQEDAEIVTVKARRGGAGAQGESIRQTKGQCGDPSFLRTVQWCIEQRCKVLGLTTERLDVTSGGQALIRRVFVELAPADETDNDLVPAPAGE